MMNGKPYPVQWRVLSEETGNDKYKTVTHLTTGYGEKTLCGRAIPRDNGQTVSVWNPGEINWLCVKCERAQWKLDRQEVAGNQLDEIRTYVTGAANVNIIEIMEAFNVSRQKARALLIVLGAKQDQSAKNVYQLNQV